MVVPFAAGSASDTVGRILAAGMSEAARPAGDHREHRRRRRHDRHARASRRLRPTAISSCFGSVDTIAINQTCYKKPLYNSATDFTPVGLIVEQPIVLIARADLPVSTLQEFIAYAKANQRKMQFGSVGPRLGSHLACARLNAAIGAETDAYSLSRLGAGDAGPRRRAASTISARSAPPRSRPLEAKTAKAIAILARERSPLFPDIPSSREQGLAGVEAYFWSGFFFPKDTPAPIVQQAARRDGRRRSRSRRRRSG